MARVPRHFRDKLVSSRTGVNTLDTSAADSARAISKLAGDVQRVAITVHEKKRKELMASEGAKKQAEFLNQYATGARDIKAQFAENPEEGFPALQKLASETKDNILGSIQNGRLRSDLSPVLDGMVAQQSVNSKAWEIGQMDTLDRQFLVDVQATNIDTIVEGATEEEYNIMLSDDTFTEENYIKKFGVEDGAKNFQTAKNAMFTARKTSLLEKGSFFAAQEFIQKSEEPDGKTRQSAETSFIRMQKGANSKAFFQTTTAAAVDIVETMGMINADDVTAAKLEDMVLDAAFRAENAPTPEAKETLITYGDILADMRDMKMEQTLLSAPGNTDVEAEIQAEFEFLFSKEDGVTTKNPELFLSDFLNFMKKVSRQGKAGNVSAGHYNKWMYWSKVALQDLDFEQKDGWWGALTGRKEGKVQLLDRDNRPLMKEKLISFINESKDAGRTNSWSRKVLQEVFEGIPRGQEANLTEESIKTLFTRGKTIANLIDLGYSVDALDSKIIKTSAGTFPWAGVDQDGMPIVSVDAGQLER